MGVRLTWTDSDETGDYVVPHVLRPRDLVSRPDNMGETVLHTRIGYNLNVMRQLEGYHANRTTN